MTSFTFGVTEMVHKHYMVPNRVSRFVFMRRIDRIILSWW